MSISPDIIEKVRQSVDIVDVIGQYVSLKRAGVYYKGLSPFNKEKTPSFMVHSQRQTFKCYSSGHGGDVFKFLMLYENIDFPSAIRRLAERANIEIPEDYSQDPQAPKVTRAMKDTLLALHSNLTQYWKETLLKSPQAEIAREYLKRRKVPQSWIEEYGLGYAPSPWDASLIWAKKAGFYEKQLLEAGIVIQSDQGRIFDRFRNRLMFPIRNDTGQIIAFSGRLLEEVKDSPKYMNSPETILFKKSRTLFGLDRAKRAILDKGQVIVCEGQIDVLRCQSAGFQHVVAPLGTAFTEEHCQILKRLTDHIVLCLDADRAGQNTAQRLGSMLVNGNNEDLRVVTQADLGIEIMELPPGQDPDSLITSQGSKAFQAILDQRVDYIDFYVQRVTQQNGETAIGRRRSVEEVAKLIAQITNGVVREQITLQAAAKLQLSIQLLAEEITRFQNLKKRNSTQEKDFPEKEVFTPAKRLNVHWQVIEMIQILAAFPSLIPEFQQKSHTNWWKDLPGAELLQKILETYSHDEWTELSQLYPLLSSEEQNFIAGIDFDTIFSISADKCFEKLHLLLQRLELEWIQRTLLEISVSLKTPNLPLEKVIKLTKKLKDLMQRKTHLTNPQF